MGAEDYNVGYLAVLPDACLRQPAYLCLLFDHLRDRVLQAFSKFSPQFLLASHMTEHDLGNQIKRLHDTWVGKAVVNAYSLLAREDDIGRAHDRQVL